MTFFFNVNILNSIPDDCGTLHTYSGHPKSLNGYVHDQLRTQFGAFLGLGLEVSLILTNEDLKTATESKGAFASPTPPAIR
jgi:hypothetical protein